MTRRVDGPGGAPPPGPNVSGPGPAAGAAAAAASAASAAASAAAAVARAGDPTRTWDAVLGPLRWRVAAYGEGAEAWLAGALGPRLRPVADDLGGDHVRAAPSPTPNAHVHAGSPGGAPAGHVHVGSPGGAPAVSVHVVDLAGGAGGFEPPPFEAGAPAPAARVWWGDGVRVAQHPASRLLSVLDARQGHAVVQSADAARLPPHERAAPFRTLHHWLLADAGGQLLHAAAIGAAAIGAAEWGASTPGAPDGVLLVGAGGRGKSTLAAVAWHLGLPFAGDDYVAVVPDAAGPVAYGAFASLKVDPALRAALRDGGGRWLAAEPAAAAGSATDKAVALLQATPPGFVEGLRLRAILLPRIDPGPMRLEACAPAEALRALAPSTLLQVAGERERAFAACASLARALPAFVLRTGPIADYADALPRVLRQAIAVGTAR